MPEIQTLSGLRLSTPHHGTGCHCSSPKLGGTIVKMPKCHLFSLFQDSRSLLKRKKKIQDFTFKDSCGGKYCKGFLSLSMEKSKFLSRACTALHSCLSHSYPPTLCQPRQRTESLPSLPFSFAPGPWHTPAGREVAAARTALLDLEAKRTC